MENKAIILVVFASLFLFLSLAFSSALVLESVDADVLAPGSEGSIDISIKNNLNDDIEQVSLSLDFTNLPFTSVGSSEDNVDDINEDDSEDFHFKIKAANDAKPGFYNIPYAITYKNQSTPQKGTIGLRVSAKTELDYSVSTENPIVGQQGKISLKIINKGLGDARFVSVKIMPGDYTVLSDEQDYIGTVSSDDFETATFDVLFKKENADLNAVVEYRDLDNNKINKDINLPLEVYSEQRATELGIIKKNNTWLYIIPIVLVIAIWLVWRAIRKRKRLNKSKEMQGR